MVSVAPHRRVVIYTRYSSDMQRAESCAIQEAAVRQELERLNIPADNALIIKDEAISGTRDDRAGFQQVAELLKSKRLGVLAVYDQSRLSRGSKVKAFIEDIVFNEGRFISVGEHTDTDQPGWELTVSFNEIHHAFANKDTARRVRSGLEYRLRDGNGSNGNFPYGYRSAYRDEDWADQLAAHRHPKKDVVIFDSEAQIVRELFRMYAEEKLSLNGIAREMNRRGTDTGLRGRKWNHKRIEKILKNERYTGRWPWGETRVVRDSAGRKRQRPVKRGEAIVVDRPALRIVDQSLWDRVRARQCEMRDMYGVGLRKQVHPKHLYPTCNLSGLVRCGVCGRHLVLTTNYGSKDKYLLCPNQRHGACSQSRQLNVRQAERAVIGLLTEICTGWPEWLAQVKTNVNEVIAVLSTGVPDEMGACRKNIEETDRQIQNLVDKLAQITGSAPSLEARLLSLEEEKSGLQTRMEELRQLSTVPTRLPDDDFIRTELAKMPMLLADSCPATADLLRRVFGDVRSLECHRPGRSKSCLQLKVRLRPLALLATALGDDWQRKLERYAPLMVTEDDAQCVEFLLNVTPLGKYETWAPRIAEMRQRGIGWEEIERASSISRSNGVALLRKWSTDVVAA